MRAAAAWRAEEKRKSENRRAAFSWRRPAPPGGEIGEPRTQISFRLQPVERGVQAPDSNPAAGALLDFAPDGHAVSALRGAHYGREDDLFELAEARVAHGYF